MRSQIIKTCAFVASYTLMCLNVNAQCILQNGVLIQPDGSPCSNTIITAVPFLRSLTLVLAPWVM